MFSKWASPFGRLYIIYYNLQRRYSLSSHLSWCGHRCGARLCERGSVSFPCNAYPLHCSSAELQAPALLQRLASDNEQMEQQVQALQQDTAGAASQTTNSSSSTPNAATSSATVRGDVDSGAAGKNSVDRNEATRAVAASSGAMPHTAQGRFSA